jgi:predicted ATPase/DNA-binding SARP family transcriptional activator
MSRLALYLLGSPRIERDGERVDIRRRKAIALLAYLAVMGGSHSRDALATLFWPEYDQSGARAGLRRVLASSKKSLGEGWLEIDRESASLNRDDGVWLDVDEFQALLAECQRHDHPGEEVCPDCLPLLAEAAELYRDDFLAGFSLRDSPGFDEWQFFQSESLRGGLASALERLTRGYGDQDEYQPAMAYARRWLALDPLREPAHRHLMGLYAQSGQRAAALRQYAECERILKEELGVSPEDETTQLYQAIKESRAGTAADSQLESIYAGLKLSNLPVPLTPFVGREAELAEIQGRLGDTTCRLLTLVGPGGSGKTRLALEATEAQIDSYPNGLFFVSLAPLDSVDSIVPTVAEALGFRFYEEVEPQQQLLDYLRQKRMLLILDNFEHLVEGAGLVIEILQTAPEVKILVTSRARLNLEGEHLFPVVGMHFPDEETMEDATQYSAIKLFLSNVRRTQPSFEPTANELMEVVRICRLVDGMPLGILLAAAWAEMLTPTEIAAEISWGLDFLETDLRDVPERQRSMRAVFDHSWNLLAEREQEVFQALSVFRGGFTREAAQEVTGASLRELMALAHKSLLHRTARGRYDMHELLRSYAAEKLDGSPAAGDAARDRHGDYYVAALQRWGEDLKGPLQQAALAKMDSDIRNARTAWDWAVKRKQVERLDRAIDGLCRFYAWRRRDSEGEAACRMAAKRLTGTASGTERRALARILAWQSTFSEALGHKELANRLLQKSLAVLEEAKLAGQDAEPERAFILLRMGDIASDSDLEQGKRLYEQSLALYEGLGDRWSTANVLGKLAWNAGSLGTYDEAERLAKESLAIRRALGDQRGVAISLWYLAATALHQGQLGEAERLTRESSVIWQDIGDRGDISFGLGIIGATVTRCGKFAEAEALCQEALAIDNDLGDRPALAWSNYMLGHTKVHLGRYDQAHAHLQVSLALSRDIGKGRVIGLSLHWLGCVALAGKAYAEAEVLLQESIAVYRELGQREDLSWALASLGVATRGLNQLPLAQRHIHEALRIVAETRAFYPLMFAVPATALLLADQGEKERAVELYALASCYAVVANSRWFEDVAGRHIAGVASSLPPEVVTAAQERGRARDLEATVKELVVELGG